MNNPSPLADELTVRIETPESVVWEGHASAVSSKNSAGVFDILPDHTNLITLVEGAPITIVTSVGDKSFTFAKAVISVRENIVSVYADIVSGNSSPELSGTPSETASNTANT